MKEMPVTVRRSIELLGIILLGYLIVVGKELIMPVLMAFFISIMLLPVYNFLKRKKIPEALAIFLSILLLAIVVALIVWFFSSQVSSLIADFPEIKKNVNKHLISISNWINEISDFSTQQQAKLLDEQANKLLNYGGNLLSGAAGSVTSTLIFIGLLPIYIYLFLFYKNLLLRFVFLWFPEENHQKVREAMLETKVIIKSYLLGLLIQISYVTVLLGGILLLIGIKHALLIAVIFAFLNLIPYVGALIGNVIGVLLTLTSSEEIWPILAVLGTIAFVQFLDNNILMPRIVGSKVKINALAAILGVFIGGSIAGISGMFLALPIIAIVKVTFDRSTIFKHWGVLLGDELPPENPMNAPELRVQTEEVKEQLEVDNDIEPTKNTKES
ncbi:AI-2E family transporter [Pedobacter sp. P351]|uniref:AI-2E family transporter n=1 Tax=Pedobacter superstes TaxID=3133441 RepID=UPI0030A3643C